MSATSSSQNLNVLRAAWREMRAEGTSRIDLSFVNGKVLFGETVVWVIPKSIVSLDDMDIDHDDVDYDDEDAASICMHNGRIRDAHQAVECLAAIQCYRELLVDNKDPYEYLCDAYGNLDCFGEIVELVRSIVARSNEVFEWKDRRTLTSPTLELSMDNIVHILASIVVQRVFELMESPNASVFADFAHFAVFV